jgi:hypothetical protein
MRAALMMDRSQFYKDLAIQFYGANRAGAKVSQGTLDQFWLWSMQAGLKNAYESIKAFSETDFHGGLEKDRCPDAGAARRRRSDRSGAQLRQKVRPAHQEGEGYLLSRCTSRDNRDAPG